MRAVIIAVAAVPVALFVALHREPEQDKPAAVAQQMDCSMDVECFGKKMLPRAATMCTLAIEKLPARSFRWVDDPLTAPRFTRVLWKDEATGALTFLGDRLEVQEPGGAYAATVYQCDYLPAEDKVTGVRLAAGRL